MSHHALSFSRRLTSRALDPLPLGPLALRHLALASLALASLLSTACAPIGAGSDIRVRNVSSYDLRELTIQTPGASHAIGALDAGEETDYYAFGTAYHYAYVEARVDGESLIIQPTDYVGETPLGLGLFTYEIDVTDDGGSLRLDIETVEDE